MSGRGSRDESCTYEKLVRESSPVAGGFWKRAAFRSPVPFVVGGRDKRKISLVGDALRWNPKSG